MAPRFGSCTPRTAYLGRAKRRPAVADHALDLRGHDVEPAPGEEGKKRVRSQPMLRASKDGRLRQEKQTQRRAEGQRKKEIRLQPIALSPSRPSAERRLEMQTLP